MTNQKLMVRTKYEKYDMLLLRPHTKGTNEISKTHDSVKKDRSVYTSEKHN